MKLTFVHKVIFPYKMNEDLVIVSGLYYPGLSACGDEPPVYEHFEVDEVKYKGNIISLICDYDEISTYFWKNKELCLK